MSTTPTGLRPRHFRLALEPLPRLIVAACFVAGCTATPSAQESSDTSAQDTSADSASTASADTSESSVTRSDATSDDASDASADTSAEESSSEVTSGGDGDGDGDGDADCAPLKGWELVWCDPFTDPEIDASKWQFEVNGQGGGNNELQYYTDRPENARVQDGRLVIEAREESFTGEDGTRDYTSARLRSFQLAQWTYGRIEVRAKTPTGQGLWPAIWMLPTDWVYGGWAASGEIDIMELLGHQPAITYGTLHYGGAWPNNSTSGENTAWGTHGYTLAEGDFSQDFHTFALEWEADEMRWYVDGEHFQTQDSWFSEAGEFPAPFDQDFHLLLNVAVGGNWPGAPDDSTVFPQRMEIDWVRVYQQP